MRGISDLESAVCDVSDMSNVLQILMEKADKEMRGAAEISCSAKAAIECTAPWRDAVTFAALHLNGLIASLKCDYYAVIERKGD